MSGINFERAGQVLQKISALSDSAAIAQAQKMILPHVLRIFSQHGHEDLRRMILTDYDLVEQQTPEGVRNALGNIGSDPQTRRQWEHLIVEYITPDNIIEWLRAPEEWLDEAEADEQRAELKRCADVIEETPGGEEWLAQQVYAIYTMAGIAPEDSTRQKPND